MKAATLRQLATSGAVIYGTPAAKIAKELESVERLKRELAQTKQDLKRAERRRK